MPHYIRGRKVKSAKKGKERKGTYKRQLRLGSLNFDLHKWIRLFSYASVVLVILAVLAAVMAFNHYKLYPGRVERDSLSSPGRGSDYIVVSWDGVQNTDV